MLPESAMPFSTIDGLCRIKTIFRPLAQPRSLINHEEVLVDEFVRAPLFRFRSVILCRSVSVILGIESETDCRSM